VTTAKNHIKVKLYSAGAQPLLPNFDYGEATIARLITDNTDYSEATTALPSTPHLENILIQTVFHVWASHAVSARRAQMFAFIVIDVDRLAIEFLEHRTVRQEKQRKLHFYGVQICTRALS